MTGSGFPDVFISYASEDEWAAKRVCAALEPEGIPCWMAPRDIPPGGDWVHSIMDAIAESKLLVLVYSRSANASGHVLREVERAVHLDKSLLPVRIDDSVPDGNLAYFVSGSHWLDAPGAELDGRAAMLVSAAAERIADPGAGWRPSEVQSPAPAHRIRGPWLAAALVLVALAAVAVVLATRGGAVELGVADARWSADTGAPIYSTPAVIGGELIIGNRAGSVWAYDADDGEVIQRYTTDGKVNSSPAVVGDTAYVGSFDGNVYALRISDLREQWTAQTGFKLYSSPAISGHTLVIGANGVLALDVEDAGATLWRRPVGPVNSSPAIADGIVYIGSDRGRLIALRLGTGNRLWSKKLGGDVYSSPVVADATVFVGSDEGLSARDVTTGDPIWEEPIPEGVISSPIVSGGKVIFGTRDGRVGALDVATGEPRWWFQASGAVNSSPVVAAGTVYVGSDDGHAYGLDVASGEQRWSFDAASPVFASPVVSGGVVYVATFGEGAVYALPAYRQ